MRFLALGLLPILAAVVSLGAPSPASAGDIFAYGVFKLVSYQQVSPSSVTLLPKPWFFLSAVGVNDSRNFTGATVRSPNGLTHQLQVVDTNTFSLIRNVLSQDALNQEFRAGSYLFTIRGRTGTKTAALNLGADEFPTIPRVSNWLEVQAVESGFPLTVIWSPFAGGTVNDAIELKISDPSGSTVYFETAKTALSDGFDGRATRVVIPAGVLPPGQTLVAALGFAKSTGTNTTAIAGAEGETGFVILTTFPIKTLPVPPVNGRFQFAVSSFAVNELRTTALVTVTRAGSSGSASLTFKADSGTATAGQDFINQTRVLEFADGVTTMRVPIALRDDFRREANETIIVSLSSPSIGSTLGTRKSAVLTIMDNEIASAGILQFQKAAAQLWETNAAVRLNIMRTGGSTGTVSARFTTLTGSASNDFSYKTGIVEFGPGETNKVIAIRLNDDQFDEPNETFSVQLSQLTGGASLGANRNCTVTLVDDDIVVIEDNTSPVRPLPSGR